MYRYLSLTLRDDDDDDNDGDAKITPEQAKEKEILKYNIDLIETIMHELGFYSDEIEKIDEKERKLIIKQQRTLLPQPTPPKGF